MNVSSIVRSQLVRLSPDRIREDVVKLRAEYEEESLQELGGSIEDEGLIQPIVVTPAGEDYELIIGSRRLRAAKHRRLSDIPAIVIEERSPLNYLLMALAENLHRQDLNAFEEGRAFLRLMKDYGLNMQEVASKTRKNENYVRVRLELLSMPDEVQAMVAEKNLGLQFIQPLARLPTGEEQVYFAKKAVSDRLALNEFQALVRRERDETSLERQSRSQFSAEKVRIRVDMFTAWLGKLPSKTVVRKMNSEERAAIARALNELEMQVRLARNLFTSGKRPEATPKPTLAYSGRAPGRNARDVWPSSDIAKILAPDRPSDEALARELGRTIGAIRAMRFQAGRSKKTGVRS